MIYIIQAGVTALGVGDTFDNAVRDANKLFEFDPNSIKQHPDFEGDMYQHSEYDLDEFIRSDYYAKHRASVQDESDESACTEELQDRRDCWALYCSQYDVPDEVREYVEIEMQVTESYYATLQRLITKRNEQNN